MSSQLCHRNSSSRGRNSAFCCIRAAAAVWYMQGSNYFPKKRQKVPQISNSKSWECRSWVNVLGSLQTRNSSSVYFHRQERGSEQNESAFSLIPPQLACLRWHQTRRSAIITAPQPFTTSLHQPPSCMFPGSPEEHGDAVTQAARKKKILTHSFHVRPCCQL